MADIAGVAKRTAKAALADNITGEAAKVAYYFFLSLFPLILALFALTGMLGGDAAFESIMSYLEDAMPSASSDFLAEFVRGVTATSRPGLLSIGLLLTLWSASNILSALGDGLNTMYGIEEGRSWWKKKLLALGLLLVTSVLLILGAAVILAGPTIIGALGLGTAANVLRWPLAFVLLVALMWIVYYYLPNRDQDDSKDAVLIGAVVGALLWLVATLLFRLYVANFGSYSETYGFVGAVIVLLLWLYITALTILFGGELASVLERGREATTAGAEVRVRAAD